MRDDADVPSLWHRISNSILRERKTKYLMSEAAQFLVKHGGAVLFGVVLLEQAGLPLPAMPWLVTAGALAAGGKGEPNFGCQCDDPGVPGSGFGLVLCGAAEWQAGVRIALPDVIGAK